MNAQTVSSSSSSYVCWLVSVSVRLPLDAVTYGIFRFEMQKQQKQTHHQIEEAQKLNKQQNCCVCASIRTEHAQVTEEPTRRNSNDITIETMCIMPWHQNIMKNR